ncbi:patr class II histocompatibility antigen, DO beta chain-like isoform X1 [Carassius carassius]|uniref:patr class II histocompatibility antigen, DO beta chain-like isoform X1 n=1 Tax=Carassius carassius TaxID=217509 RepID=UPI0028691BF8|nr:patr class II histocompatibility antigen, DO beta chain-like isoform X1 [Carassius carassius]
MFYVDIGIVLPICFFFSAVLSDAQQEKHFLHYMFTVMIKADTLPVFSAVCESDHIQISHYSTEEQIWMRENLTEHDWDRAPEGPPETTDWYLDLIRILSNRTESSDLFVLQRVIGCELEKLPDGAVNLTPVDEYGFGGEDCVAFSSDTSQCSDKSLNVKETKIKRDHRVKLQEFFKNCLDWISTFNNTKKNSPDVHVFARKAPDDHSKLVLICLVTGFYPRDIEMNIRLNRINIQNQTSSGVRHNNDETFQMRSSVEIDRNHRGSYDCRVIHSSLTEPVSVDWDGRCSGCDPESQMSVTVGILISALVLAVVFSVIPRCINRRKKHHGLMRSYHYYGGTTEQLQFPEASDQELNTDF